VQNSLDTRDKILFTECQVTFALPGIPFSAELARRSLRLVAVE